MWHRITVFSVQVLKDERIVVVAEQRPECTEEQVTVAVVLNQLSFVFISHLIG